MSLHRLGPPDKSLARYRLAADPADTRGPHRLLTGPVVLISVEMESKDNLNVILRFIKVILILASFQFLHLKVY